MCPRVEAAEVCWGGILMLVAGEVLAKISPVSSGARRSDPLAWGARLGGQRGGQITGSVGWIVGQPNLSDAHAHRFFPLSATWPPAFRHEAGQECRTDRAAQCLGWPARA